MDDTTTGSTQIEHAATAVAGGAVASQLGGSLISGHHADVGRARERARQQRLQKLAITLGLPMTFLWWRFFTGDPVNFLAMPDLGPDAMMYVLPLVLILALGGAVAMPLLNGRSPHMRISPDQIDVGFDDVIGMGPIMGEVTRTLNVFMGHKTYRDKLGGRPRRGVLFEGPPGTGKTHMAKAMAKEADVPYLFVSATSFQSMYYGATSKKIRSYFKELRKVAREEGGAIGFIEEIDAIGLARGGMKRSGMQSAATSASHSSVLDNTLGGACYSSVSAAFGPEISADGPLVVNALSSSEGASGVVNELLVQMQSFDDPPRDIAIRNWWASKLNAFLPPHRQIASKPSPYNNILVIAATNRAADLDPALLRPGRFDKALSFDPPAQPARRDLLDYFLARKSHHADLDLEEHRHQISLQSMGYTPVMIENLLDEALLVAIRDGRDEMSFADVQQARLDIEVGLANPIPYTAAERHRVATHEAGHAVMAHLTGHRKLEILSIVKRKGSLGLLAHGDCEEVYTRLSGELHDMMDIAMGGKAAEELWYADVSTGPGSDLAAATRTACEIVGMHGMGRSLVSLAAVQQSAVNSTNIVGRVLGDAQTRDEVEGLLRASHQRAVQTLKANEHLVMALRDALLERDELIGAEITDVLATAGPAVEIDLTDAVEA